MHKCINLTLKLKVEVRNKKNHAKDHRGLCSGFSHLLGCPRTGLKENVYSFIGLVGQGMH